MLEFTRDPEWQRKREESWKAVEEDIQEGLTRKRVNEFKSYYITGLIPGGVKIGPGMAMRLLPDPSIEGIQYCLKINYPDGLSAQDMVELQRVLSIGVNGIRELSREGQVKVFRYVMGDAFDPHRDFPFKIGEGEEVYKVTVKPMYILNGALVSLVQWVEGLEYSDSFPFWAELTKYILSVFMHVNPNIFTFSAAVNIDNRKEYSREERTAINYTWRLFRHCISPPSSIDDSIEGQQRKRFLEEFRAEFEKLNEYPGELGKV